MLGRYSFMLKRRWWDGAHKILETAQRPNSPFPLLFYLTLGLDLGLGLVNICVSFPPWGHSTWVKLSSSLEFHLATSPEIFVTWSKYFLKYEIFRKNNTGYSCVIDKHKAKSQSKAQAPKRERGIWPLGSSLKYYGPPPNWCEKNPIFKVWNFSRLFFWRLP